MTNVIATVEPTQVPARQPIAAPTPRQMFADRAADQRRDGVEKVEDRHHAGAAQQQRGLVAGVDAQRARRAGDERQRQMTIVAA